MVLFSNRTIDELGRVVLPVELRKTLGWDERDTIDISLNPDDGTATLMLSKKHSGPKCVFCGNTNVELAFKGSDICGSCINNIISAASNNTP